MIVIQVGWELFIGVEPQKHDAKVMHAGQPGLFGGKKVRVMEKIYQVQVAGYVVDNGQILSSVVSELAW